MPVEVTAVAFGPKSKPGEPLMLATADAGGHVVLWKWRPAGKTPNPQPIANLEIQNSKDHKAHSDRVTALRFLPDGRRLLSASYDKTVAQWDLVHKPGSGSPAAVPSAGVSSMDLTQDGRWLVTSCLDNVIRLWDVEQARIGPQASAARVSPGPRGEPPSPIRNKEHEEEFPMKTWKRRSPSSPRMRLRQIPPERRLGTGAWSN